MAKWEINLFHYTIFQLENGQHLSYDGKMGN